MKILLPPSASKTAPTHGPTLDLSQLAAPELTPARTAVIAELMELSKRDEAFAILKASAAMAGELKAQSELLAQPCSPAWQLYTGVLFNAVDFPGLTPAQLDRAARQVAIFAGPFGFTGATDLIPSYRMPMNVKFPKLGAITSWWKKNLAEVDLADNELVLDARSAEYRVTKHPGAVAISAARVHGGKRTVVSHQAKYYRGLLTGALLREANEPKNIAELAEFAKTLIDQGHIHAVETAAHELTLVEIRD